MSTVQKACGLDEPPCRILKDGHKVVAEPILQIVNMSLGLKFAEGCQTAKVRPTFKKGKNTEPNKYIPVLLLPVILKVIERVVHKQLIEHLEKHYIILDYQSVFRSKHFVNTCLAHLSNQIVNKLEATKPTIKIFIDFQKAFVALDH